MLAAQIVSPFDNSADGDDTSSVNVATQDKNSVGPLDLTWDNVEMVLEEMRPYLIQDGGNVAIREIDGPVVRLELQVCVFVCVVCRGFLVKADTSSSYTCTFVSPRWINVMT
jgi:hypothetical protein